MANSVFKFGTNLYTSLVYPIRNKLQVSSDGLPRQTLVRRRQNKGYCSITKLPNNSFSGK